MRKLFLDFETRSSVDIKKVGGWAYARHPSTEIMCVAYSLAGDPVVVLTAEDLKNHAPIPIAGATLVAHNAHFEYAIWNYILHQRRGYEALWEPGRWDCTLARAAMCSLPLSLDKCGAALNISAKKDLTGRAAMLKLCRPIDVDPLGDSTYNESPSLYQTLYRYCAGDVEAEMEIDRRLPTLPPQERALWELDLLVNRRGLQTDVPMAVNAAAMAATLTDGLNGDLNRLTGGAVDKTSRVAEIKRYLEAQGITGIESLDKASVTTLLARTDVAQHVKDVLRIRQQAGKSSTAKYAAVVAAADPADGRVRGVLQYHAASTGRWGGRLIQPHNFPKGLGEADQRRAVGAILEGDADMFALEYGAQALDTLSGALRGVICAARGKSLVVADFASIEARVLLWLAQDSNALNMFATGANLYLDMAEFIYQRKGITKKDALEYAVGKMTILGAGFGMGPDRFQAQCATFGISITPEMAAKAIKAYRGKYKTVVDLWYATEAAARDAVKNPGTVHGGLVKWGMDAKREFLCARLPSGRHLRYFKPFTKMIETKWGSERDEIHYMAAGLGGALEEQKTYGGSLVENVVQALARDIMAGAMLRVEAAGYPVVLTVHDEVGAEIQTPEDPKSCLEKFIKLMCVVPPWATGLPLAAEGWIGSRYRK